jgi:hypothetical protein
VVVQQRTDGTRARFISALHLDLSDPELSSSLRRSPHLPMYMTPVQGDSTPALAAWERAMYSPPMEESRPTSERRSRPGAKLDIFSIIRWSRHQDPTAEPPTGDTQSSTPARRIQIGRSYREESMKEEVIGRLLPLFE